jgi:hypothetical protein
MSDAAKASKAVTTFEGFEMPKFEMPAAIRGLPKRLEWRPRRTTKR